MHNFRESRACTALLQCRGRFVCVLLVSVEDVHSSDGPAQRPAVVHVPGYPSVHVLFPLMQPQNHREAHAAKESQAVDKEVTSVFYFTVRVLILHAFAPVVSAQP